MVLLAAIKLFAPALDAFHYVVILVIVLVLPTMGSKTSN